MQLRVLKQTAYSERTYQFKIDALCIIVISCREIIIIINQSEIVIAVNVPVNGGVINSLPGSEGNTEKEEKTGNDP